jgi:putative methyltransferase (TIGR04325 family)
MDKGKNKNCLSSTIPMRNILKLFVPPILIQWYRNSTSRGITFTGKYNNWKEAISKSKGFDDPAILEAVRTSARKVKGGKAAYERDSVLHNKIDYSWPVLACLENVALNNNNRLHVIDYGGSLGTSYLQNQAFLKHLKSLKWYVVEQPHYVECGKAEFETSELKFEYSIDDVLKSTEIDCVLLSGVLQVLSDPKQWVEKMISFNFEYLIIDRTSFIAGNERLMIEGVPKEIYKTSFPCWFFNERHFLSQFTEKYDLITDFESSDGSTISNDMKKLYWKGFFFKLKRSL